MSHVRALRYLAPNLITAVNLFIGFLSLLACYEGRYIDAAWLIVYAVLIDRLDGFVARVVRGTSELGVHLDSFADFLNFGVAPAILVYVSLGQESLLPFQSGPTRALLMLGCTLWIFGAVFRLARYNITTGATMYPKIFFGVPTTLVGGLLVIWYLALVKYAPPDGPLATEPFGGGKIFGDAVATPPAAWRLVPVFMILGAALMASTLRMPKLGLTRAKVATAFVFANVFLGYVFGFARLFPEYMVWPPTLWLLVFLLWGQLSPAARTMKPPPLFPRVDPPVGSQPIRPEDDLLPEGQDTALDEQTAATVDESATRRV